MFGLRSRRCGENPEYLTGLLILFSLVNGLTEYPPEKIHLFEYFVLGVMVIRAIGLKKDVLSFRDILPQPHFVFLPG